MAKKKIILASGSPRRRELLANANIAFEVVVSDIEEHFDETAPPSEIVQSLALQKAEAVAKQLNENAIVIGADTIVTLDEQILGKPKDTEDAKKMLEMLSGREHVVYTGVAILSQQQTITFHEATKVQFWELTSEEIDEYIRTGDPFDKAGAYGIQTYGATLVKKIDGDYFSVVGLPISRTVRELKKLQNSDENS